jgi:predicted cation transporter
LLLKKTQLEVDLMHQMRLRNALQAWLYVHVPVSVAMLVAVGIHIFVVFWY